MQFFIDTGIMARLTAVTVQGRRLRTVDYLSEHAEKLVAAMTMKQLPNELVLYSLTVTIFIVFCLGGSKDRTDRVVIE